MMDQLVTYDGLRVRVSNLLDWGTHWFDMFFFYNNDEPAEWVIGQIGVTEERIVFGTQVETSGLSWIRWKNGVEGFVNNWWCFFKWIFQSNYWYEGYR